jgi:N,N-dimethylformamidase
VRPAVAPSDVALLIPTASYLAYANDHPGSDGQMAQAVAGATPVLRATDLLLHEHREWGLSCYDAHADGSGVACSTRLRPMLNMRPTHRYHVGPWQLPADLAVVSWLDDQRIDFDVLTDDDLHVEGVGLLAPYRCVITGTHPEYYTTAMLDGIERWLDAGGHLVYLGANGFYWRTAYDPARPFLVEIRRANAGSRAWESPPGEDHLASTGERGGLWRNLGRSPQRLTGVGYAAQGFDRCSPYRRLAASRDARAAFIFDGVDSEVFGTAGDIGGGAAGQEVDRFDTALGTPTDALLLATSDALSEGYQRCVEEIGFTVAGTNSLFDPAVRADVVYHVRPGGGAVFATGSIAWAGSLSTDADVGRITANVITRFRDPRPLDW